MREIVDGVLGSMSSYPYRFNGYCWGKERSGGKSDEIVIYELTM